MNKDRLTADEWSRIEKVFDAVLQKPEAEQQSVLEKLTYGRPKLRDEVASLLKHDREEAGLPAVVTNNNVNVPSRTPGDIVAGYRLLFPLSIQTSSEVWCASTPTSDERVAMKFLAGDIRNKRRLIRFEQEAKLLAGFRHPNIAEFVNCGRDDTSHPFIVMRYCAGKPINTFADDKRLSVDDRIRLMLGVCEAVSYAHRFLVVHRDLKPANIIVGDDGQPVVLDFGISKELDSRATQSRADQVIQLTATTDRPMTPAFAAPEQVHGEPITTATDVYALGLILYELLSGHHAYSNAAHPTAERLFDRICTEVPRNPSAVVLQAARVLGGGDHLPADGPRLIAALRGLSPSQLRKRLSGSIDSVVMQAIAKSPDSRYRSVGDLRSDLLAILERRPVSARKDRDRVGRVIRRRPYVAVVTTALIAGFLTMAGTIFWRRPIESSATESVDIARDGEKQARADARAAKNSEVQALKQSRQLLSDVRSAFGVEGALGTELTATLARQAAKRGRIDETLELLDRAGVNEQSSLQARVDAAVAYQRIGRPTNGYRLLQALRPTQDLVAQARKELTNPVDLQIAMLQLLLDAHRVDETAEWRELRIVDRDVDQLGTDAVLTLAESRVRIAWMDGALALVDILNRKPGRSLTSAQRDRADFIRWRASENVPAPPRLLELTSGSLESLAVRADALLTAAAKDRERDDRAAASAKLKVVAKCFEKGALKNHRCAIQAWSAMGAIAEDLQQWETVRAQYLEAWECAESVDELGTHYALRAAAGLMRSGADTYELLAKLESYEDACESSPYVHRSLLIPEIKTALGKKDWQRAIKAAERLCSYEAKLWGEVSTENAWATAALAMARSGARLNAEPLQESTASIVDRLETKDGFAKVFLAPVAAYDPTNAGLRLDEWIELYVNHQHDELLLQFKMILYTLEEHENAKPDLTTLIKATSEVLESGASVPLDQINRFKSISGKLTPIESLSGGPQ